MRREIDPERLLTHADNLARGSGGRGQPRNIDLRRATSAAYYAVFHRITVGSVECLAPLASREHQLRLVRSFQHGSVAQICHWTVGSRAPSASSALRPVVDDLKQDGRIVDVAQTFLTLQQRRHEADYDHLADFNRPDTVALVALAQRAAQDSSLLSASARGGMFLLLVALQSGLGR